MSDPIREGAERGVAGYMDRIVREARADERRRTIATALETCARQTQLASLVAGRPSDFEKGVMSCMAAIQALADQEFRT